MRQTLLLNLVVLVFFVLLFVSVYRRRPSGRLRFWVFGWLFAVAHFAVGLVRPAGALVDAASVGALLLCGISFLASFCGAEASRDRRIVFVGLAAPTLGFTAALAFQAHPGGLAVALDLLLQGFGLVVLWRSGPRRWAVSVPGTVLVLLACEWSVLAVVHERDALSPLLMELFAACALMFASNRGRRSPGAWTTIAGFVAWAAVFPVATLMEAHFPGRFVDPEIWNVPKIVVAFGMLVSLLEDELTLSEQEHEQYRSLFHGNPLPMWIFASESTRLLEANSAAIRTFGWSRGDLPGLALDDLLSSGQEGPFGLTEMHWSLVAGGRPEPAPPPEEVARRRVMHFQTKAGEERAVEVSLQRVSFQGAEAGLLVAKDVTAEIEAHRQLVHQANHDPLTGLPNRLLLHDRLRSALAKVARHGTQAAIVCIDLDRFKQINDTWGHAAGDSCLREVADRFRRRLRSVDTAARTGGEEFMVILDEIGSRADAERVADDLLASLAAPHRIDGHSLFLSASIGIALAPTDGREPSELWTRADAAMYRAKENGGGCHMFFSRTGERA